MKVSYQSGSLYIVTFGQQHGQEMGRLVDMEEKTRPGPLVPVGSIAAHLPYENFVPFQGDPQPILEYVQRSLPA